MSLRSRAFAFALCVGGVAFILAMLAVAHPGPDGTGVFGAMSVAIVCAAMSWASTFQAVSGVAIAVDAAADRMERAAHGDLTSHTPDSVGAALPDLAQALDGMLAQVHATLDNANTLALFDPVTALPNRTHFRGMAERALAATGEGDVCALIFIDLDNFKSVNDSLGHARGDQVLARVANRLRAVAAVEAARHGDSGYDPLVGRLAGDEFTMMLSHLDDRDDAARFGEQIQTALARPFDVGGQLVGVGASVGIALSPEHGTTLAALMRAADVAMYDAKASGRGQCRFYAENQVGGAASRSQLEAELREAIAGTQFTIVFQPQIALSDGQVVMAEGLLRWRHPRDGLRLPASFIACADESGLIGAIGDWAIEELARCAAGWPERQMAPRLAVNFSPRQIGRVDFFTRLRGALDRWEVDVSLFEFEVEEAVLMQCGARVLGELHALRAGGATVAIDDFGAGLSSLARLRDLPFDAVKIDAGLIAGIEDDAAARGLAQAVVALTHSLGARAIAEGVETSGQYHLLRAMGCDAAQGYAIASPMAEDDYRAWAGKPSARIRA